MSATNYMYLPTADALRWFKVLAVFRFAAAQGEAPGFALPPDRLPLRLSPSHKEATILLIDDQDLLREAVGEYLAMQGYEVKPAENGAQAMLRLEEGLRPDLVICDVMLPDIQGSSLIREAQMLIPELKVLFMSGHPEETFFSDISGFAFLQKPFRLDILARRVKSLIDVEIH